MPVERMLGDLMHENHGIALSSRIAVPGHARVARSRGKLHASASFLAVRIPPPLLIQLRAAFSQRAFLYLRALRCGTCGEGRLQMFF